MSRGGAHFSSEEVAQVLSHYDIGVIHQAKPLSAGNRRAPKMVIISENGKYLLKRRPKGKDDLYRVAFSHSVQMHLGEKGFPVTSLVATRDEKNTVLQLDNHIYEFFKFITGYRYDGSAEATLDSGRQLGNFHNYLSDFASEWQPLRGSFHDSSTVRRQLKVISSNRNKVDGGDTVDAFVIEGGRDKGLSRTVESLMLLYNKSSVRVNELGFDFWEQQVVHGDWHPGNMLFSGKNLVAVLDFDSVKVSPAVTDLANGMLQFSIVGGRPNPADWPAYLDEGKLVQFFEGYREVVELEKVKSDSLLDLMIETIIAEAVLPVATTGFFGHLSGSDFLKMIHRKAEWIDKNRGTLSDAMGR